MTMATTFKPDYIEHKGMSTASLSNYLSQALDEIGCTEKHIDLKAHRILGKAIHGDYQVLCWWAEVQEDVISDCRPMHTINKENATLLGICALPRTGKSGDSEAIARINARIKEKVEQYMQAPRT